MVRDQRHERGQATVELALVLPIVVMLALAVTQVAVIAVDSVLVHHAAREAARAAAVEPNRQVALNAAQGSAGLAGDRLAIQLGGGTSAGDTLTVTVSYQAPTEVPIVGSMIGDVSLQSSVSIRVE